MIYTLAFNFAVAETLEHEGGYSNDPEDPGGETNFGISKAQYPDVDIKNLTREGAIAIYWRDYWLPLNLNAVQNMDVAAEIFDTGVNTGQEMAGMILQGALTLLGRPLKIDGVIGPLTIEAVNTYRYPGALLKLMNVFQGMVYLLGARSVDEVIEMIRARKDHVKRNLRGWFRRVEL